MITCTRRIQFCAGHRVVGHEGMCANLHGHNYVAFITAQAPNLDNVGRVIDFSVLKEKIGGWIDANWDHGFVLFQDDQATIDALKAFSVHEAGHLSKFFKLPTNPTAENLAEYLLEVVCPRELEGTEVLVHRVVLWETENCYAEAEL